MKPRKPCAECGAPVPKTVAKFCSDACYKTAVRRVPECSVDGCRNRSHAIGLCNKHHKRLRATGTTSSPRDRTYPDQFWSRVSIGGPDECWLWNGAIQTGKWGYGFFQLSYSNRVTSILAHRFAYMLATAEDVRGWVVMHSCDNPPCVNPAHLRRGTQKDNVADMDAKGRRVVAGTALARKKSA